MIDPALARAELAQLVDDYRARLETGDLAASVGSCPGWTVEDLTRHLGEVYTWAEGLVRGGAVPAVEPLPAGAPRAGLLAWFAATSSALQQTLAATDPDAVVTVFDGQPGPASFWMRRQLHETAIHRWDLGTATGAEVVHPTDLALDGIDEVVAVLFPRQVRLGRTAPLAYSLALRASDRDRIWVLAGDGTAATPPPPVATVTGPAGVLLLLLWGRVDWDDRRLRLDGDAAAARAVLAAALVP